VACTGCEEHLFLSDCIGAWFWCDDALRAFPMLASPGFCHGCGQITIVGRPPTERNRVRMQWFMRNFEEVRREWPDNFEERFPDFPPVTFDISARLCQPRDFLGLCLRCGSAFVTPFPADFDRWPREGAEPVPTGIRHGCGGTVVMADSGGLKCWAGFNPHVFDLRGRMIYGEPLPWDEVEEPEIWQVGDSLVRV
jgi:hypothetical protein